MKRVFIFLLCIFIVIPFVMIHISAKSTSEEKLNVVSDQIRLVEHNGIYTITYGNSNRTNMSSYSSTFECKFYMLEGYAYTNNMLIGYVDNEVYDTILYCSIDLTSGTLNLVTQNNDDTISKQVYKNNLIYIDGVRAPLSLDQNEVSFVSYERVSIDDNYNLYMRLMQSVFWNFENENPDYLNITEDFYSQRHNTLNDKAVNSTSSGHSFNVSGTESAIASFNQVVNVYFNERCLKETGCYTGYAYDQYYNKIGYYNVQTFIQDGNLNSLIAVWDLELTVSNRNANGLKNVRSEFEKVFNLCTSGYNSANGTISVAEAPTNSSYVITNNAKVALGLIGSQNHAYINDILFRRAEGGNSSQPEPISQRIGNALAKLLLPDEAITTFSAILDVCTEVGNWTYNSGTYAVNNSSNHHRIISNEYPSPTYKLFSKFDIRANIKNIPVLGQAVAQYELDIVSCPASGTSHTITVRIQKSIAD